MKTYWGLNEAGNLNPGILAPGPTLLIPQPNLSVSTAEPSHPAKVMGSNGPLRRPAGRGWPLSVSAVTLCRPWGSWPLTGPVEDPGCGLVICIQWSCSLQIYQEIRVRSRSDESPAVGIVRRRLTGLGVLGSSAGLWGLSSPESGPMRHLCALCLFLPPFAQTEEVTGFITCKCTFLGAWDPTSELLTPLGQRRVHSVLANVPCSLPPRSP